VFLAQPRCYVKVGHHPGPPCCVVLEGLSFRMSKEVQYGEEEVETFAFQAEIA
jgi:hypothetical protein